MFHYYQQHDMILYLKSWANYQIYNNLLFVVCSDLFLH